MFSVFGNCIDTCMEKFEGLSVVLLLKLLD